MEKLKLAFNYGADSVYLAGKKYGLRAGADNFTLAEIESGIQYARVRNKKVYVTVNIIPHNTDLKILPGYIKRLYEMGADGVIAADPGIIMIIRDIAPQLSITLSTQANCTNLKSAAFWFGQGVGKVTLARELSLQEIQEIVKQAPKGQKFEVFIHGSLCISYSGRCLLSSYMADRDSNRGLCAHSCRWKYHLVEQKRPGEYFPVYESERGTYIMNSRDLCLIEYIPELIQSGVSSFKIEGRMKSLLYTATVTSVYRKAIDSYMEEGENYVPQPEWMEELKKINHRGYTRGFIQSRPGHESCIYDGETYRSRYDLAGIVLGYDADNHTAIVRQKNKFAIGDTIEVIGPGRDYFTQKVADIYDENNEPVDAAPHAGQTVKLSVRRAVKPMDIIRKKI
ncbi:MAG: peptidase U32 family protein [Elusimicrobiota bacterium]